MYFFFIILQKMEGHIINPMELFL